jgi:NCS1 family nucleobase:cation symporter-1
MATQTLYAGYLMANMLRCIFGHKWTDIPNHLPANAGTTSQGLIAFFIFWCIQLPFAWIHPSKAVPIFAAKSVVVPVALIATMIWALVHSSNIQLCLFMLMNL